MLGCCQPRILSQTPWFRVDPTTAPHSSCVQTAILLPITIWVRFSCFKLFRRPLELLSVRAAVDLDIHDQVHPTAVLAHGCSWDAVLVDWWTDGNLLCCLLSHTGRQPPRPIFPVRATIVQRLEPD